jgi:hypothetical protein
MYPLRSSFHCAWYANKRGGRESFQRNEPVDDPRQVARHREALINIATAIRKIAAHMMYATSFSFTEADALPAFERCGARREARGDFLVAVVADFGDCDGVVPWR